MVYLNGKNASNLYVEDVQGTNDQEILENWQLFEENINTLHKQLEGTSPNLLFASQIYFLFAGCFSSKQL